VPFTGKELDSQAITPLRVYAARQITTAIHKHLDYGTIKKDVQREDLARINIYHDSAILMVYFGIEARLLALDGDALRGRLVHQACLLLAIWRAAHLHTELAVVTRSQALERVLAGLEYLPKYWEE
jgi:hypothetical protein